MAVVPVKRIEVIGRHAQCQEIIEALHELETIQLTDPKEVLPETEYSEFLAPEEISDRELEERLVRLGYTIDYLADFVPKEGFLTSLMRGKFVLTPKGFADVLSKFNPDQVCNECKELANNLRRLSSERQDLVGQREDMEPWVNLDVPLAEVSDTRSTRMLLGTLPAGSLDKFKEGILNVSPESYVAQVTSDKTSSYVLLVFLKDSEEKVASVLKEQGFDSIDYPRVDVTPRELLSQIDKSLQGIESKEEKLREKGRKLASQRPKLMALYDYYIHMKERQDARSFLLKTRNVFYLAGWIRARDARKVRRELTKRFEPITVTISSPKKGEEAPVLLENRPVIRPFEFVTKLYGLPCYYEVEPTPILAPFFALFFGLCLTDAGYGAILALLAYLGLKKLSFGEEGKSLLRLLFLVGVVTIMVGVLTGGFFGIDFNLLPQRLGFLQRIRSSLMLFDPLKNPLVFLALALGLGVVHVSCGFATKMYADIKAGRISDGFLDQGSWLVLVPGLIIFGMAKMGRLPEEPWTLLGLAMALIGAGTILFFKGRAAKNIFARFGSGLYGLYQITGVFSDVLSYSRLMALGLASCVLAQAVNMISAMILKIPFAGPLLMVFFLIGGHLFVMVINTLGGFIHTVRLQFVEFFQKFYIGGGEAFKPFRSETKYTIIRLVGSGN